MQNSARWVLPVMSTSRLRSRRSISQGAGVSPVRNAAKRDLQFVEVFVAAFVDARRLRGGADEQAGKAVGQRGVVLPVGDQRGEQIGPAQEGAVLGRGAAEGDVVAAAGAGVAAVEHELLGAQARQARFVVEPFGGLDQFVPVRRGMDVDLDDAGIRRDGKALQARILGRRVALDDHRQREFGGGVLDRREQFGVVFEVGERRHEDMQPPLPRLDAECGVQHFGEVGVRLAGVGGGGFGQHGFRRFDEAGIARLDFAVQIGRERRAVLETAALGGDVALLFGYPGQAVERQAQTHGRCARHEVHGAAAKLPGAGAPGFVLPVPGQRQGVADRLVESARERDGEFCALFRMFQIRGQPVDVDGFAGFAPEMVERVLETRYQGVFAVQAEPRRKVASEGERLFGAVTVVAGVVGEQCGIAPQRFAVAAPVAAERPARQGLARVPFALAVVQQRRVREGLGETLEQIVGTLAFVLAERESVPLRAVHVVDRDESGFAAQGQAHVVGVEIGVDLAAEGDDVGPGGIVVGLGDARVFVDTGDIVAEFELDLAAVGGTDDRGGAGGLRRTGQRDVPFAGEQAGGGVEADPAGTGQVDLGPGVQIGEIVGGAFGAFQRLFVGDQLHQIAGHEARSQPQVAQDLHQQPGAVAAGAAGDFEGFLAALDAGLHAHDVADVALQALVDRDQEIDRGRFFALDFTQPFQQSRAAFADLEIGPQLGGQFGRVLERVVLGFGFQEKVEGVDGHQVGDDFDVDQQFACGLGEGQAGQVIAEGILLPVDEVVGRFDLERVGFYGCAGMRGRAQPDHVGSQLDLAVEAVMRCMTDRYTDCHDQLPLPL